MLRTFTRPLTLVVDETGITPERNYTMCFWIISDSTQRPHQIRLLFLSRQIVLSSDSTCILVRNCLFCIEHLLCSVGLWHMLGRYCGGLNKLHSIWFVESQTHFGMPKCAKMKLALNEPHYIASNSTLPPSMHYKWIEIFDIRVILLTQWNLLSGVGPWWSSVGCFAYKISNFF